MTAKKRVKTKDKPWIEAKIFTFGAKAPVEEKELFDEELKKGHHYRNALVNLERSRRDRDRKAILRLPRGSKLQKLEDSIETKLIELADLRAQKKELNACQRTKDIIDPVLASKIKTLTTALSTLKKQRKDLKKSLYESAAWKRGAPSRLNWFNSENRRIYGEANVSAWGTLVRIADEVKPARIKPTPPKPKRWDGSGKVAVQCEGLRADGLLAGTDTRLRIERVDGGIWVPGARKKRPRNPPPNMRLDADGYAMRFVGTAWVYMRLASRNKRGEMVKGGHTPVWCKLPIIMHRPLPENSEIKWAWVRRLKIGRKEKWEFQVVVNTNKEAAEAASPMPQRTGQVAIDVGWRLVESDQPNCGFKSKEHDELQHATGCNQADLRVAYWRGSDGREGELRLPSRLVCAYYKAHDIHAIRDKKFNDALSALRNWAKTIGVPDWLPDELTYSHAWRKHGRLFNLFKMWKTRRFVSDQEPFDALAEWARQSAHLLDYESNLREQVGNARKDLYRKFVSELSRSYKTMILEDIDLRNFAKRKEAEDSHLEVEAARKRRSLASISSMRGFIAERMDVIKVNPAGTSYICNNCGLPTFKGQSHTVLNCSACSTVTDRDSNAAKNILDRGLEKITKRSSA